MRGLGLRDEGFTGACAHFLTDEGLGLGLGLGCRVQGVGCRT